MTNKNRLLPRNFRKLSISERQKMLGFDESCLLSLEQANTMIENVTGVFGLPQALVPNFLMNDKLYQVPLVVEEPSVVVALNYTSLLASKAGGFKAEADTPLLIGQVQIVDVKDQEKALEALNQSKDQIIAKANQTMTRMVARGGGVKDLRFKTYESMMVVEFFVDTCDAMGANHVNTLCEALAPEIESLTGGVVLLRILSNLTDHALVRAQVTLPESALGTEVCDHIVLANEFACVDTHRAVTHNKGIMNGIDALLVATGNDWRAVEAGVHAYASYEGAYKALTTWERLSCGSLRGAIEIPLKLGIVGDSLKANPAVKANLELLGVESATELAMVTASIGLAQNLAALKALVTTGIQHGHMKYNERCKTKE